MIARDEAEKKKKNLGTKANLARPAFESSRNEGKELGPARIFLREKAYEIDGGDWFPRSSGPSIARDCKRRA